MLKIIATNWDLLLTLKKKSKNICSKSLFFRGGGGSKLIVCKLTDISVVSCHCPVLSPAYPAPGLQLQPLRSSLLSQRCHLLLLLLPQVLPSLQVGCRLHPETPPLLVDLLRCCLQTRLLQQARLQARLQASPRRPQQVSGLESFHCPRLRCHFHWLPLTVENIIQATFRRFMGNR